MAIQDMQLTPEALPLFGVSPATRTFITLLSQLTHVRFVCHSQTQESSKLDTMLVVGPGFCPVLETEAALEPDKLGSKRLESNQSRTPRTQTKEKHSTVNITFDSE